MNNIFDIAIIGGGTAGMTAAIYGCRAGKKVILIEKAVYGGQIISSSEVENYPAFSPSTGYDFAIELHQQVCDLNVPQFTDEVIKLEKSISSGNEYLWNVICTKTSYSAKTIILATGTVNRSLSLPGEEKYTGHGLSYCAICDGAFHKGKTVAVVGGGNSAMEEALYLSLLCNKVYLIQRGNEFTAEETLIKEALERNAIIPFLNTTVTKLYGDDKLEKIEISSKSNTKTLDISGLFVAIGRIPQNQNFASVLKLDEQGYIEAGENCCTSIPGIFAAGDCRTKELRQLVTAASDGATAATEAIKFLKKKMSPK